MVLEKTTRDYRNLEEKLRKNGQQATPAWPRRMHCVGRQGERHNTKVPDGICHLLSHFIYFFIFFYSSSSNPLCTKVNNKIQKELGKEKEDLYTFSFHFLLHEERWTKEHKACKSEGLFLFRTRFEIIITMRLK